ncbi:MAG TPA: ATP-binding protein [Clostridia bacterium]|nr:ATP-binding protein [Clostridia bacterium]
MSLEFDVEGDNFVSAGKASEAVKGNLKMLGLPPTIIRRAAIVMYEGEINMVIHAKGGKAYVDITDKDISITLKDEGPGIENIELAMQEGYSTAPDAIRALGFGAGMGLPNMKKYSDNMEIESEVGKGTTVRMKINIQPDSEGQQQ